jgi:hypothetical protein
MQIEQIKKNVLFVISRNEKSPREARQRLDNHLHASA